MKTFAAIDFETANYDADSACAVGLVIVKGSRIVNQQVYLIRPPTRQFVFTDIHGLTWGDVRNAPTFRELWPTLRGLIAEVNFLAAHNASFDRRVLESCCLTHRMKRPTYSFICTMTLARSVWGIYPTKLPNVCKHLGIPLNHHKAGSDAEACARIVLAAKKAGWHI